MRKTTYAAACIVFTLGAISAQAQDFLVVYLQGNVEYLDGSRWSQTFIGEQIPADSRIRLGERGFLEVVAGDRTLLYSEPGTYSLGASVVPENTGATDIGSVIRRTVSRFAGDSAPRHRSVAAGVRAAEATQETSVEWIGDESPDELLNEGISLLDDGNTEEASFLFEDAYSLATGSERHEAGFFFVYTLYILDEWSLASEVIDDLSPESDTPYHIDYSLIAAEILLGEGRKDDAAQLLRDVLHTHGTISETQPLTAQALYFLLGQAHERTDPDAAAEYFFQAAQIAPTTLIGIDAASRR